MGLHWAPETSMRVIVACLPVMSLHTLSVSAVSYQLIRQSARQNQMLDELRRVDALTGLFGRGHWQEQAEAALRRHHTTDEPACMLMLDIDHFKEINDAYGHTVGDEVIRALAHVVRGNVRAGDCAGRYGGDEFAIVLPGMHARDALAIAQRIREQTEGVRLRSLPESTDVSEVGLRLRSTQSTESLCPAQHLTVSSKILLIRLKPCLLVSQRRLKCHGRILTCGVPIHLLIRLLSSQLLLLELVILSLLVSCQCLLCLRIGITIQSLEPLKLRLLPLHT